ncbi:MAG: hypothetical protein QM831_18760 [Kofleriaceae bacterium]
MVDRWERVANGLLTTAIVFVVFAAYEMFLDKDSAGALMAIIPAAIFVALWRGAIWYGDR